MAIRPEAAVKGRDDAAWLDAAEARVDEVLRQGHDRKVLAVGISVTVAVEGSVSEEAFHALVKKYRDVGWEARWRWEAGERVQVSLAWRPVEEISRG